MITNMINVTPKAVDKIRETLQKNSVVGGLRLGVVGGGCSSPCPLTRAAET